MRVATRFNGVALACVVLLATSGSMLAAARETATYALPFDPAEAEARIASARTTNEVEAVNALWPMAQTTNGAARGFTDLLTGVGVWLGLPFAAPPVGDLRFRAPQAAPSWSGVRNAWSLGSVCPQIHIASVLMLGAEDCLYVNVFVPPGVQPGAPAPVLLWIYGGGWSIGDGYEFGLYDGKKLAEQHGVVVVTFNYRLDVLGFLSHPALQAEDAARSTGNMALRDQRQAMQWVQANIAAFGGDPARVTIAGESAGAFSMCWHLVSAESAPLFHAAVLESGTCDSPDFYPTTDDAFAFSREYALGVGCNDTALSGAEFVACMRALPLDQVLLPMLSWLNPAWPNVSGGSLGGHGRHWKSHIAPIMPWGAVRDGSPEGLLDMPYALIRAGKFARVPIIMGFNKNEGTLFVPMLPIMNSTFTFPVTNESFPRVLSTFFNASVVDAIVELYPSAAFSDEDHRFARVLRDFFFICPGRRTMRALTAAPGAAPLYSYLFTYDDNWFDYFLLGDTHSEELEYVFGNPFPWPLRSFSANDTAVSNMFGTFWTNLVKNGDPNTGAAVPIAWPAFVNGGEQRLEIDTPPRLASFLGADVCDFWDGVVELFA